MATERRMGPGLSPSAAGPDNRDPDCSTTTLIADHKDRTHGGRKSSGSSQSFLRGLASQRKEPSVAVADVVHFGDYRLDMPKALSVLDYLVTRPGQLVTKDELFVAVWPEAVVSEGTLAECIRGVRRALGETARAPRYVETVHRRGYRFIGQLAKSAVAPSPPPRTRLVVGRHAPGGVCGGRGGDREDDAGGSLCGAAAGRRELLGGAGAVH